MEIPSLVHQLGYSDASGFATAMHKCITPYRVLL